MRIRLEEDGVDKFKVVLPDRNKDFPIGTVWKDIFSAGSWKAKAYFSIYKTYSSVEKQKFDDFMQAARALAKAYEDSHIDIFEEDYGFEWPYGSD